MDSNRTECCHANLITTLVKETEIWTIKIVSERFGLMVLIMYMATLGMLIYFLWDKQHRPMACSMTFWLDFGKSHDNLDIRGKL